MSSTKIPKPEYQKPLPIYVPRVKNTETLYTLEDERDIAIKKAADELGKILKFKPSQFWTHILPLELLNILEGYDNSVSILVATAYLESKGWKVEPEEG